MCMKDKQTIIELRSEDGVSLASGDAHETTTMRFSNLDFRGILNDHPEGDKGLWNVEVCYFNLYQPQGVTNAEAIEIEIEQITSPFVLSSRSSPNMVLASAPCKIAQDVDNGATSQILPIGFYIAGYESSPRTCRINFSNWNVRLFSDRGRSILQSSYPSTNIINNWVMRLKVSPYDPSH